MKRMVTLLSAGLLLVGCGIGDKNSPEAKRYEIQKALDEGNYDKIINILISDPTYGGAMSAEEGNMYLGAAYVGKAGFDVNGIVNVLVESGTTKVQGNDTFKQFVKSVSKNASREAPLYLSRASDLYEKAAGNISCKNIPAGASDMAKDACFYKGIVDVATAGTTIIDIVDDVDSWLNPQGCSDDANNNGVGDGGDASACAMEYAVNGNCTVPNAVPTSIKNPLTFTDSAGNNYSYELIKIDVNPTNPPCTNPNSFYRLLELSNSGKVLAITKGACDTNFNPCSPIDPNSNCYPCPVVLDGQSLDVVDTVTTTLESSADVIDEFTSGNSDVNGAINDFLNEACGNDNQCTQDEIANYLSQ